MDKPLNKLTIPFLTAIHEEIDEDSNSREVLLQRVRKADIGAGNITAFDQRVSKVCATRTHCISETC